MPASSGATLTGSLANVNSSATDSGDVWVAERLESGLSRVDRFNGATDEYVSPQLDEEGGVNELAHGVAVGHPEGEEEIFVGAAKEGTNAVAVYGPSGKLQGAWTGALTPSKGFGRIAGVAIDGSASLETHGELYVETSSTESSPAVVDVFKPKAGGGEPPEVAAELTGTPSGPFLEPTGIAVSAFNGDVLVSERHSVHVFEPVSGTPGAYQWLFDITTAAPAALEEAASVAVDGGNGNIYVVERATRVVDEFTAKGEYLGRITGTPAGVFKEVRSIAVDASSHQIYVGDHDGQAEVGVIDVYGPDRTVPDVETSSASQVGPEGATLNGTVNPRNAGAASCRFVWGETEAFGHSAPCSTVVPNGEVSVPVLATLSDLAPDTTYYFRLESENEAGGLNPGEPFQTKQFKTPGPGISGTSVADVAATSATLRATIDPNGGATSYYFEYGNTAAYGSTAPLAPGEALGSGEPGVEVERNVQGLAAGSTYHYRAVAVADVEVSPGNFESRTFAGPDESFQTAGSEASSGLPDGRRWQLVSPADKHGAAIFIGPVTQASASGSKVTYIASLPTGEHPRGFILEEQVLGTRSNSAWSTQDISAAHASARALGEESKFFSEDLSQALIEPNPEGEFLPLAPEATPPDTEFTQYIRHNLTCFTSAAGCFEPLLTSAPGFTDVPEGTVFGGRTRFVDATPDLSHVILTSQVALTHIPTAAPELYEWSAGVPADQALQLVSVLPESEEAAGEGGQLGLGNSAVPNAISGDGTRIVWAKAGEHPHLYLRDTAVDATLQLDAVKSGTGAGRATPHYQYASRDGSRIFFTDEQKLTEGSGASLGQPDLYACDVVTLGTEIRCELSDLTPPSSGEAAGVQGDLLGGSNDGSVVYFVANGKLAVGAIAGNCTATNPVPDARCNLYARHEGATRLVAIVSNEDYPDWAAGQPDDLMSQTSRVSSSGRWLAFMSDQRLTGYNNEDVTSTRAHPRSDEEVFLYDFSGDAGAGQLICASCDPSGARPVGVEYGTLHLVAGVEVWNPDRWIAASIPGWSPSGISLSLYQPRYLSDSGRLFFNSSDELVPQDANGNLDVYEFEPAGTGSCTSASSTFVASSGGCVSLISSGAAAGESAFIDASENGNDVFFVTSGQLVPEDVDTARDLYDAHVCSGEAPCARSTSVPPPCTTADSCRSAPTPQPSLFAPPASATFSGAGNVAPAVSPKPGKTSAQIAAEKLKRALKACRRPGSRKHRRSCERRAQRQFGPLRGKKASGKTKGGK